MSEKIQEDKLRSLLTEVEQDLEQAYALEKSNLLKKDEDESKMEDKEGSPKMSLKDSPPPAEAPPAEDAPAEAPPAEDAPAEAPPAEAPPAEDALAEAPPAEDAPMTPEALQAEYSQLSPEELDMHIKAALAAKEALGAVGSPAPPAAPASPPAAPLEAPPAAMKSEMPDVSIEKLEKQAEEISEMMALIKSQKEDIENLTKSIQMVVERPVRKTVTSMADLSKTEEKKTFTVAEAHQVIKEGASKLNKAERDLVLGYFAGTVPSKKLEPILEKLTKN